MLMWLGTPTANSARLVVQADSAGMLSAACNGQTLIGDTVDPEVEAGVGVIDVDGLQEGSAYQCDVFLAGNLIGSLTLKTLPGRLKIGVGSCVSPTREFLSGFKLARKDWALFANLGDFPYMDTAGAAWGYTAPVFDTFAACTAVENYWTHYLRQRTVPGWQAFRSAVPQLEIHDDHEAPGDDWDNTIAMCNGVFPGICAVQQDVTDITTVWRAAAATFQKGNRQNADPGIDAGALYHRFAVGDTELFVLDCISYRDGKTTNGTMLGSTQKQWLKDRLLASTATFKLVLSSKTTVALAGGNNDSWGEYNTERDEILSYIHNSGIRGVLWMTGDQHRPFIAATTTEEGSAFDHAQVCACPINVNYNGAVNPIKGWVKSAWNTSGVVGEVESMGEYLEVRLIRLRDMVTIFAGRVYAGSNRLVYQASSGIGV